MRQYRGAARRWWGCYSTTSDCKLSKDGWLIELTCKLTTKWRKLATHVVRYQIHKI